MSLLYPFRTRVYHILNADDGGQTTIERVTDWFLILLVLLNAATVVMQSVKSVDARYHPFFVGFELVSMYVFTLEYALRVWSCVEDRRYQRPWRGRLAFVLSPLALIDLLAILPFFLSVGLVDLRILRVVRLLRVLKVARYVRALHVIGHVIRRKRAELLVTLGVLGLMLLLVSSLMYIIESEAQPDKFGSIPDTMWWGVATLTTVGYGDVFPITPAGKLLSSLIAVLGLGLFAIPTGILASGFSEQLQEQHAAEAKFTFCPHCGHKL
ncbi:potassium channel family protein [Hymenobacter monticola]|uniref:Potassium channel family protein n=1 Tax=Hymenobacter monticola TaxID=1705399 RepID=A0ABY4BI25_9BACT|nr:potassium channel family protein [Hymenobacter monticola]UOE36265.1 potassium channel family protein [Hymenobacter monticola]